MSLTAADRLELRGRSFGHWLALVLSAVFSVLGAVLVYGPLQALPFGSSHWDSPWTIVIGAALLVFFGVGGVPAMLARVRGARSAVMIDRRGIAIERRPRIAWSDVRGIRAVHSEQVMDVTADALRRDTQARPVLTRWLTRAGRQRGIALPSVVGSSPAALAELIQAAQAHFTADGPLPAQLAAATAGVGQQPRPTPPAAAMQGDAVVLPISRWPLVLALLGAVAFAAVGCMLLAGMVTGVLELESIWEAVLPGAIAVLAVAFFGVLGIPVLLRRIRHASRAVVLEPRGLWLEGRGPIDWFDVRDVRVGVGELLLDVAPAAYQADLRSRWLLDRWMQRANRGFRGDALAMPWPQGVSNVELERWIMDARGAHTRGHTDTDTNADGRNDA